MHRTSRSPAFTLIELLVVIAIIAVLAVVVILTLNPADLLRQARDSSRLSDLSTLNSAINQYSADLGGSPSFSMGTPFVTYLSIPDPTATTTAGTDCSDLGFPSGTTLHCPASSTFKNVDGTGWIPIDFTKMSSGAPFGTLPVDSVNQTSTDLYYTYATDGTTFKIMAMPESEKYVTETGKNSDLFAAGSNLGLDGGSWVLVPGNPTFDTHDFYVMKYDAVCSDGKGHVVNTHSTLSGGYDWLEQPCTSDNGLQIAAFTGAIPIVDIIQSAAISACRAIGAHLITNNEWQTIAWNAENVAANWSGASVGSGAIYSGHNDAKPPLASPASANDAQSCAGTDGPASCGGTGWKTSQIRTLTLSNGSVIWDMAGNVWQWTDDTITGSNEPHGSAEGWNWNQFTNITTWGSMSQQTAGPINSTWNSSQGIGEIYSENAVNGSTYGFTRGGNYGSDSNAGVEALAPNNGPPNTNTATGFRCAR